MNPLAIDWHAPQRADRPRFPAGRGLSWSIAIIVTRAARPRLSMFALLPWCFWSASLSLRRSHLCGTRRTERSRRRRLLVGAGLYRSDRRRRWGRWCIMEATAKLPTLVSSVGFLATPAISLLLANLLLREPFTPRSAGRFGADHGRRRLRRVAARRRPHDPERASRAGRGTARRWFCCTACSARRGNFGVVQRGSPARTGSSPSTCATTATARTRPTCVTHAWRTTCGRRCGRWKIGRRRGRPLDGRQGGDGGGAALARGGRASAGVGHRAGGYDHRPPADYALP